MTNMQLLQYWIISLSIHWQTFLILCLLWLSWWSILCRLHSHSKVSCRVVQPSFNLVSVLVYNFKSLSWYLYSLVPRLLTWGLGTRLSWYNNKINNSFCFVLQFVLNATGGKSYHPHCSYCLYPAATHCCSTYSCVVSVMKFKLENARLNRNTQ